MGRPCRSPPYLWRNYGCLGLVQVAVIGVSCRNTSHACSKESILQNSSLTLSLSASCSRMRHCFSWGSWDSVILSSRPTYARLIGEEARSRSPFSVSKCMLSPHLYAHTVLSLGANSWCHAASQVLIFHICSWFSEQVTTFVTNAVSFYIDALEQGNFTDS